MKTTGIVRGIDSLGRIVLPKELRTNMHIDKDSKLEIFVEGDGGRHGPVRGLLHLPRLPGQDCRAVS